MYMNIFNLIKLSPQEVMKFSGASTSSVERSGCLVIRVADEDGNPTRGLIECIMDQMTILSLSNEFLDLDKIREDSGIPEEATVKHSCFGRGTAEWAFQWGKDMEQGKTIRFTKKELEEKYVFKGKEDYYVCWINPVSFWDNDCETHEAICNLIGSVKPGMFYRLGEKELSAIEKIDGFFEPGDLQPEEGMMAYYVMD